jgi:N-ethylmaleimide reductase
MTDTLFSEFQLGDLRLPNRIVMAPMTRSRALGNIPNDLMATFYAQRADAGLLITEGTAPSRNGLGYARIPGIYSNEQIAGWKRVTDAVHAEGGGIFLQIMHVGRVGHPHNIPEGGELVAPSAIAAKGEMYTDEAGPQPQPVPREMTLAYVAAARDEYVQASKNAIAAGFDGVELHAANGYLMNQFLNPQSNTRTDAYGGSAEARNRFVLETAAAVVEAIGAGRVGLRVSPYGVFNDLSAFEGIDDQYAALAKGLGELGLAYLHLVDHAAMGAPPVSWDIKDRLRDAFGGPIILSGGYDAERGEADLAEGRGHLVAYGRPFISNPDLVTRLKTGADLAAPNFDLFYTPGPEGYTDYPTL